MSASFSTPKKKTTSSAHTPNTPPLSRHQSELLGLIGQEIGAHTWQFPASVVAQMLSPKRLKTRVKDTVYHPIGDYDCLIDEKFVQKALAKYKAPARPTLDPSVERRNYDPVSKFLNTCVENCQSAYIRACGNSRPKSRFGKLQQSGSNWWPGLTFFEYDKQTGDGVGGAEPVKPDFVGARGKPPNKKDRCYWAPPDPDQVGIYFPGEVKKNWPELIRQAATYARAMTSAVPLRLFSVVIGVNHKDETLRFLIFHRGGLTASEELDLKTEADRWAVQKILFSVYLWQKPQDAGFPAFTNGRDYILPDPRDIETELPLKVTAYLYHALSVRGRGSFVVSLDLVQPHPNDSTKSPPSNLRQSARIRLKKSNSRSITGSTPQACRKGAHDVNECGNQGSFQERTYVFTKSATSRGSANRYQTHLCYALSQSRTRHHSTINLPLY
ncbi:hypothetical protein K435DRAFT_457431 [Dendrothele bispora CBS 962.96]|uniref:Fungal-type protein kinase domain-containing protein n=1 Tax=Dendrothele bispora (strain CBS 962.96) TaxID=1314807 RepID=A0A4S8L1J5_DENBC|nr:hypothetical protein K435DRAFT_457431 [Dendrothele bispora CBS 962.96]